MEVSGQLHDPAALPPGKKILVPIGEEAGWFPEPVWSGGEEKHSQPLPGFEPPIIHPVTQRYTAKLSRSLHSREFLQ
jgi:hypothetical protein